MSFAVSFVHILFRIYTWNKNLTFVKTDFQLLKLQFHACNFEQAFYSLHKLYGASCDLDNSKYFYSILFGTWLSNLHV